MDVSEMGHRDLFDALDTDRANVIWKWKLLEELKQCGLQSDDPRVERAVSGALSTGAGFEPGQPEWLDFEQFSMAAQEPVIWRALQGELAVAPAEFAELTSGIEQIYTNLLPDRSGKVAQHIPTLRDADPDKFAIAICTADGQMFQIGDADLGFSVRNRSVMPWRWSSSARRRCTSGWARNRVAGPSTIPSCPWTRPASRRTR